MSGHSKWSTIKRKKGAADAQRGKIFTKIAREIMVAARDGGPDGDTNPRLRAALQAARGANMPKDNQERAIKKGAGTADGVNYSEALYEGRGPAGVAFVIEVLTDNKNRTVAELRHKFSKSGGELGADGSATWMFERKGVFVVPHDRVDEDTLLEKIMDVGGDDVVEEDPNWIVLCEASAFAVVQNAVDRYEPASSTFQWLVKSENAVALTGESAISVAKLWAALDDLDDVQSCYCSATLPGDVMEEYGP